MCIAVYFSSLITIGVITFVLFGIAAFVVIGLIPVYLPKSGSSSQQTTTTIATTTTSNSTLKKKIFEIEGNLLLLRGGNITVLC